MSTGAVVPEDMKRLLMTAAEKSYGNISPCGGRSWAECFTTEWISGVQRALFWFNDAADNSTHMVHARL